jgi:catechol 2,3-dioxygenase-like lactoylglutathione lyase family enzyme
MITGISHLTILVDDQQKALEFYTHKLGFALHTDAQFGSERWLTVCPKNNRDLEFALMLSNKNNKSHVGLQVPELPVCTLAVDDCIKTFDELSSRGVEFTIKPEVQPWGVSAAFKDLYGNIFYITQPS